MEWSQLLLLFCLFSTLSAAGDDLLSVEEGERIVNAALEGVHMFFKNGGQDPVDKLLGEDFQFRATSAPELKHGRVAFWEQFLGPWVNHIEYWEASERIIIVDQGRRTVTATYTVAGKLGTNENVLNDQISIIKVDKKNNISSWELYWNQKAGNQATERLKESGEVPDEVEEPVPILSVEEGEAIMDQFVEAVHQTMTYKNTSLMDSLISENVLADHTGIPEKFNGSEQYATMLKNWMEYFTYWKASCPYKVVDQTNKILLATCITSHIAGEKERIKPIKEMLVLELDEENKVSRFSGYWNEQLINEAIAKLPTKEEPKAKPPAKEEPKEKEDL